MGKKNHDPDYMSRFPEQEACFDRIMELVQSTEKSLDTMPKLLGSDLDPVLDELLEQIGQNLEDIRTNINDIEDRML